MGVDTNLYIWGEKVPDEKLALINAGLREKYGDPFYPRNGDHVMLCTWFDEVPGTVLYQMDTDGARHFYPGMSRGSTGWPTVLDRIRMAQAHFPDHFIIYTNDSSNIEDFDHSRCIVTEEMIQEHQEAWEKIQDEYG